MFTVIPCQCLTIVWTNYFRMLVVQFCHILSNRARYLQPSFVFAGSFYRYINIVRQKCMHQMMKNWVLVFAPKIKVLILIVWASEQKLSQYSTRKQWKQKFLRFFKSFCVLCFEIRWLKRYDYPDCGHCCPILKFLWNILSPRKDTEKNSGTFESDPKDFNFDHFWSWKVHAYKEKWIAIPYLYNFTSHFRLLKNAIFQKQKIISSKIQYHAIGEFMTDLINRINPETLWIIVRIPTNKNFAISSKFWENFVCTTFFSKPLTLWNFELQKRQEFP